LGSWFTPAILKNHEDSHGHKSAVQTQIKLAKKEAEIAKSLKASTSAASAQQHCHDSQRTAQNELEKAVEFAQLSGLVRTVIKMAYDAQPFSALGMDVKCARANGAELPDPDAYGSGCNGDRAKELTIVISNYKKQQIKESVQKSLFWTFACDAT